jgi:hypothetical protein
MKKSFSLNSSIRGLFQKSCSRVLAAFGYSLVWLPQAAEKTFEKPWCNSVSYEG